MVNTKIQEYEIHVLDAQDNCIKAKIIKDYNSKELTILFNKKEYKEQFDNNWYNTLRNLDEELNKQGFRIICNGTSKGVYPSGFCTNMGDGSLCYDYNNHAKVEKLPTVNTFEYSDWNEYVSRQEQEETVSIKKK